MMQRGRAGGALSEEENRALALDQGVSARVVAERRRRRSCVLQILTMDVGPWDGAPETDSVGGERE